MWFARAKRSDSVIVYGGITDFLERGCAVRGGDEHPTSRQVFVLDVGGEGRHAEAWNLNPSRKRTFGVHRGEPIPRLIQGRGEAIPLADRSVDVLLVERTPLRPATLREILRVAKPSARLVLRHVVGPFGDPHRLVLQMLTGEAQRNWATIGRHRVRETRIRRDAFRGNYRP